MSINNLGTEERITVRGSVSCVTFPALDALGFVKHGFVLRTGGVSTGCYSSMNLSFTIGDQKEAVEENFRRVAGFFDTTPDRMVAAYQTHTSDVMRVGEEEAGRGVTRERLYPDIDGLLTDVPDLVLTTSHADCTPLFFVDPVNRAIALTHSGWKGTAGRIGAKTVEAMRREFGTKPEDIYAAIGPCICMDCYEVGEEVADIFISRYGALTVFSSLCKAGPMLRRKENGKYLLNQRSINMKILYDAGVRKDKISISRLCTYENEDLLFSHRRTGVKRGNLRAFLSIDRGGGSCPETGTKKIYCTS